LAGLPQAGQASIGGTGGNGRLLSDRRFGELLAPAAAGVLLSSSFFCLFRELTLASAHVLASSLDGHAKRVRLTRGVNFSAAIFSDIEVRMVSWQ
jgi:hypothetical protein